MSDYSPTTAPPSDQSPSRSGEGDWEATTFVYGVWGLMVVALFAFLWYYSHNVPYIDDWAIVPYMTGEAPVTVGYLWDEHNEHRIPVPKLLLLFLYELCGGDFRVGMYFNVAVVGAVSFGFLKLVRHLRGRMLSTDAFIPLLLLSWGHVENLMWSWQVQFALSTLLLAVIFGIVLRKGLRPTVADAFALGACLTVLPLCGSQGIPFVMTMAAWLGYVSFQRWREGGPAATRQAALILAAALPGPLLVGLYFIGYRPNPGDYAQVLNPSPRAIVATCLEVASMTLGPGVARYFPDDFLSPYSWLVVLTVWAVSVALVVAVWRQRPAEQTRTLGVLCFLAAVTGLTLAVGRARAGDVNTRGQGFQLRYALMIAPALYSVYFVWSAYGPPRAGRFLRMALFTLVCSMSVLNVSEAVRFAKERSGWEARFLDDLEAGRSVYQLTRLYTSTLTYEMSQPEFAECLRMLRRGRIGPYRRLNEDPNFQEIPLPLQPAQAQGVTWSGEGKGVAAGSKSYLEYHLPEPRFLGGIRLTIAYPERPAAAPGDPPAPLPWLRRDFLKLAYFNHHPPDLEPQRGGDSHLELPWTHKAELIDGDLPRLKLAWKTVKQPDFIEINFPCFHEPHWQDERYLEPVARPQSVTIWVAEPIDRFRLYPNFPLQIIDPQGQYCPKNPERPCAFTLREIVLLATGDPGGWDRPPP